MWPDSRSIVVSRTAGITVLDRNYHGRGLYATLFGGNQFVSGEDLLAAIEATCGNQQGGIQIEVACPPHHYFLIFSSDNYSTQVLNDSGRIRWLDSRVDFARWHRGSHATQSELA
jgi:hypothetical protein